MNFLMSIFGDIIGVTLTFVIVVTAVIVAWIMFRRFYRVASANEALVISGGRRAKPQVIIAGGKFVSPLKKCVTFPLNVMTIRSDEQETQSNSMVPIIVQWTAQLRADTTNEETLEQAVIGFLGSSEGDIRDSLKQTLDGEVRAVLGLMTPEDVVRNKADLSTKVSDNVNDRMKELGFILISLNIAEVTDRNNHYFNLGAMEREGRRREAENITAEAEQSIAETKAATDKAARFAELEKEENVAERQRDVDLKRAGFKAEVDQAQTDADYAGQVREQERLTDLATRQGAVAVERERQGQAAAEARRNVVTTEAETARQKLTIEAEAQREKSEIEATATATIIRTRATGEAEAAREQARGDADAIKTRADAQAEQIRKAGQANADAEEALGKARAAAALAEGQARAEAERLMAEALSANDAVNLQVTLAEIESKTRIEVSTAIATAVAEVGTNTTIIDMSGGSSTGDGDLLNRFLGNLPETLKRLDVKNEALNGKSVTDSINALSAALLNQNPMLDVSDVATEPEEPDELKPTLVDDALVDDALSPGESAEDTPLSDEPLKTTVDKTSSLDEDSDLLPFVSDRLVADSTPVSAYPVESGYGSLSTAGYAAPEVGEPVVVTIDPAPAEGAAAAVAMVSAAPVAVAAVTPAVTAAVEATQAAVSTVESYLAAAVALAEAEPDDSAPITAADAISVLSQLASSYNLNSVEIEEVADIVRFLASNTKLSEADVNSLVDFSVFTIRQMRENGQTINPRSIAIQMIDIDGDGKASVRELISAARRIRQAQRARR
ncbi:MAG: SPFH domain-containing protein [Coriobacteriia bacterium]|nr:SPFH domain-containing protein [Coriobacteriia bacterium]